MAWLWMRETGMVDEAADGGASGQEGEFMTAWPLSAELRATCVVQRQAKLRAALGERDWTG